MMKLLPLLIVVFTVIPSALIAGEMGVVTTPHEALQRKTTLEFKSKSIADAVLLLTKHVQENLPTGSTLTLQIKINSADLKLEGVTQRQLIRNFQQRDKPLRNVLTALVQQLNPNSTIKDATDPGQKIVWVVVADPEDADHEMILITTREMAKKRSYQLPHEFTPNGEK